jgi:integrase
MKDLFRIKTYNHSDTAKYVVECPPKEFKGLDGSSRKKRVRQFFASHEAAQRFVNEETVKVLNGGLKARDITDSLRIMAVDCENALAPHGKTIQDVTNFYLDYLARTKRSCSFRQLADEFIASKVKNKKSVRYIGDLRSRLPRFSATFGDRLVTTIETREVDLWLEDLDLAGQTKLNFRRVLHAVFRFGYRRGYCSFNPVSETEKPKVVNGDKAIFTVEQVQKLLESSDDKTLPVIALGAFAGIRPEELSKLTWAHVQFDHGVIQVDPKTSKTASNRYVEITDNLRQWLAPYVNRTGPIIPKNCRRLMEATRERAGITVWPHDVLRSCFASFHLAHHQDAQKLRGFLGHETTDMLFRHYRYRVKAEDAKRYWEITPKSATDQDQPTNVIPIAVAA